MESLHLALVGLALPIRREPREAASKYSASIGLIGAAAEQAMGAILVHVFGEDALQVSDSQFKTAREVLADLRDLLRSPVPRASFLTTGVSDPAAHLTALHSATSGFTVLLAERAAGLHAGSGPSREAAMVAAKKVHDFLELLASSTRIRSYLDELPQLPAPVLHPNLLLDELLAKLAASDVLTEKAAILRSLFLILPEVPDTAPDWLGAIERVALAPTDRDVVLLVSALEAAIPVQLQRASARGQGISVVVRPDDPNAIPIAVQHLRRSFTQIADQWNADIGNANGRLDAGVLDCPPDDFVLDLFVLGSAELKKTLGKDAFTAHEVWPFVASALIRHGTPGPYWFLVRLTNDFGQLSSLMQKAFTLGKGEGRASRQAELLQGIEALSKSAPLDGQAKLFTEITKLLKESAKARSKLSVAIDRNRTGTRAFPTTGETLVRSVSQDEATVGEAIEVLLKASAGQPAKRYWARVLCESASDPLDRRPLVSVLRIPELDAAHTAARKALRLIDAMDNGPSMQVEGA